MPARGSRPRRASPLVAATAVLLAVGHLAAAPADGATVRRTWSATLGEAGAWGTSTIQGFTTGSGRFTARLAGLGAGGRWTVAIHRGKCPSLGTRVVDLGSATGDGGGSATVTRSLGLAAMNAVWKATWDYNTVALRVASGGTVRCATYDFPRATRVAVAGMGIDLPVKLGPRTGLPCDVAFYIRELSQPGEPGVTLLFAHARTGMFLPLLTASRVNNGAAMIGRTVRVWTSASNVYTYRISQVRRHQTSIQGAFAVKGRVLWLQTSEGPLASSTKLVVVATQVAGPEPATYAESHPRARPISCWP